MAIVLNPQTGRYETTLAPTVASSTVSDALERKKAQRLQQYGYDATITPKRTTLETLLDWLSRPEAASASLIGGLGMGQDWNTSWQRMVDSLKGTRKYSYHDMLGELGVGGTAQDIAGFGLGTLLDPTTYIPVGKIAEGMGKVSKAVLPKVATEALGKVVKATKGAVGVKTFENEGMKNLDTLLKGVSGGTNFVASTNFEKYKPLFTSMMTMDDDALKLVGRAIEKPKTYLKKLDEAGLSLYKGLDTMFKETGESKKAFGIVTELINEAKPKQLGLTGIPKPKVMGLGGAEADAYLPHMITDEFRQKLLDLGKTPEEAINTLRGLTRANLPKTEKTRTLMGTIADLNRQAEKKYGMPIFESDMKKIVPKYVYNYSKNIALSDLNKEILKLTDSSGKPLIKAIGRNGVSEGMVKLSGLPYEMGYEASPEVAKQINRVMGILGSDPTLNKFLKGFDKVQNFWKKSVTVVNPSFHLNNLMGATFNNFIKDSNSLSPETIAQTLKVLSDKAVEITGKGNKVSGKEFLEYLQKHGALTSFVSPEAVVKPTGTASKIMNQIGGGVENIARTQLAIAEYKKTGNLMDAVRAVWGVHGNYSPEAMSSFERNFVKRVVPFYNWARTNIPFQIKNLVNKTGKYSALARMENLAVSPEERAQLPEWMRGEILTPTSTVNGVKSTRSLNLPIGDINDISLDPTRGLGGNMMESLRRLSGRLSPAVKTPIELAANKNFFYDQPIVDQNLPVSMQKSNAPSITKYFPEALKKLIGYQEVAKTSDVTGETTVKPQMNAVLNYLSTQLNPISRYGNLPKNITNEMTATGMNANNLNTILAALAAITLPAKAQSFNVAEAAASNQKAREAELQARINYLIQSGLIPKLK